MRNRALFSITLISLVCFWQYAWFSFKQYYSGIEEAKQEIVRINEELALQKELNALNVFKFNEFKQEVVSIITEKDFGDKSLPFNTDIEKRRDLASVLSVSVNEKSLQVSTEQKIEQAAKAYDEEKYLEAIILADEIVKKSPVTSNLARAYFILAESLFQTRKFSESIEVTNKMMELFPENDLTGFSLLRVGQILISRQRQQDAAFTFALVRDSFDHPGLKKNANAFLSNLNIRGIE